MEDVYYQQVRDVLAFHLFRLDLNKISSNQKVFQLTFSIQKQI